MRTLAGEDDPPAPSPDPEHVEIEIDGESWSVAVLGRSGGTAPGRVPMLLLGFWPTVPGEAEGDPQREALVLGRTLDGLTPNDLVRGFSRSCPYRVVEEAPADPPSRSRHGGARGRRDS